MIKVELLFEGNPFQITVVEVKKRVLLSFKKGMDGQLGEILTHYKVMWKMLNRF
jgi:hypothetical protein